ncbi:MAG: Jag N-terminal domain-containing protein, partial [Candidatus Dependentiae bacterium]|jgi:predicted RNA-binding protein Jag
MRSILLEASSIERAIDKAWNEAGKPREFTIKVHDEGERNFLGFSRRPARLSILFVPQRDENSSRSSRGRSRNNDSRRGGGRNDRNDRNDRRSNNRNETSDRRSSRSNAPTRFPEDKPSTRSNDSNQDWRGEWEKYVITTVRDITKLMGITVPFEARRDDKMLTLSFKKAVLEDAEEQHMLFASLSYLSIQFLKRHYKNRFLGYRVLVTCADKGAAADKPARKSEAKASRNDQHDIVESITQSMDVGDEKVEATPRGRSAKSADKPKEGKAQESKPKPRGKKAAANDAGDDIVSEQIRFAQEQLEREKAEAAVEKKAAPAKEAAQADSAPAEAPVKEAAPAEKPAKKKPAKKEAPKLRRFYVMPDEEGNGGDK